MNRRNQLILGGSALVVVFSAALGLSFTQREGEEAAGPNKVQLASMNDEEGQRACASAATYDRLKTALFDDAMKVRSSASENLETLAAHSVVRMEDPVVKGRDPSVGAINCAGTFILELPPGAERAFGGERRLTADINYTARPAADGSGTVYQINGAERIMARLADFDLQGRPYVPPLEAETQFAEAMPPPLAMGGPEEPVPPEEVQRAEAIDRSEVQARAERRQREQRQEAREERAERQRLASIERPRERRRAEARSRGTARPSFNCRYARTRSEIMVCNDRGLAAHDREMSAMFYAAMDDADRRTRRELNRTRDRFLAYRDRCRSEACVADAYQGRMREIADIMAARE